MDLPESEAHLWYVVPSRVDPDRLQRAIPWLSEKERARHSGFHAKHDGHEYLVTQTLARVALAPYLDSAPEALRFRWDKNGKPHLDPSTLQFNLSNCRSLVACLVFRSDVGVDVEEWARMPDVREVIDSITSAAERAKLATLAEESRARRCLRIWTLKEAYLKAIGIGLGLPLGSITVDVDAHRLSFEAPVNDDPDAWQLGTHEIEGCLIATVARHTTPVRVLVREARL